jgi:hypothetical protein
LRRTALPAGFPELPPSAAPSRPCVGCHASPKDELPRASAATIVFGARHAHAELPGGCIGCHGMPRDARGRLDHGFRVEQRSCKTCHASGTDERKVGGVTIRERAEKLAARIGAAKGPMPPHASPSARDDRAARLVRVVLEDPAAAIHNAPHARALLDEAEALLAE